MESQNRVTDVENTLMVTQQQGKGRINGEIWIDIYRLLYNTGNSTQNSVMAYMGKESKNEWICVYV